VLAAAVIYLVVGFSAGAQHGRSGDPAIFIRPGSAFVAPELLPADAKVFPGTGYDGQFFFYIAQDPLLGGTVASRDDETSSHLDNIAYRYQRILLPALGWLTSWGNPDVLEWTLPLLNVLAVLGSGFLLARFLASRGRSPWLSLVYMASFGVVVGVTNDLSDPLAAGLFVAGAIWWLEGRATLSVAALAACLLARELYLIPVVAIAILELARGPRRGVVWLLPLAVLAAWQAYLRLAFAAPVTPADTERPGLVPLQGVFEKIKEVLRVDWLGVANWELLFVGFLLVTVAYFFAESVVAADRMRRSRRLPGREELLPVVALAAVALIPFLTLALWRNIPSYGRYSAPAAGMLVLLYAVGRDRSARFLMAALVALTLTNPVVALLPVRHTDAPLDPAAQPTP
jgi:hypothetical protein